MSAFRTSLILTVLNEAASMDELLLSIERQVRLPDEVVIVDGGSTDGTWRRLERWNPTEFRVVRLSRPGCSISVGRNQAIRAATGDIIAVTDAGVRLSDDWLAELLAPFAELNPPSVVSGFFRSAPRNVFELSLGATTLPDCDDVAPATFLPSSRSVAFRRAAWELIGGYPEWLDYCEDLVFDFALRRAGLTFRFAPGAVVRFRPRPSLRQFFWQYYRYGRGDGKADLWRARHAIRYATYLGAPALLVITRAHPFALAVLGLAGLAYCRRPCQRLSPRLAGLSLKERVGALGLIPLIRLTADLAKMAGYPAGVFWRFRNRPQLKGER